MEGFDEGVSLWPLLFRSLFGLEWKSMFGGLWTCIPSLVGANVARRTLQGLAGKLIGRRYSMKPSELVDRVYIMQCFQERVE